MSGHQSDRPGRARAKPSSPAAGRLGRRRATPTNLGGLDHMIGYVVRRAQMWMVQDFRRALKGLDITPAQFAVMRIIAANPGLSQIRVSEALSIERARLVQMIDHLEAAGRVQRARSATDRRSHALHLTSAGQDLLARSVGPMEVHERNVVARLGPRGKDELLRILAPFLE